MDVLKARLCVRKYSLLACLRPSINACCLSVVALTQRLNVVLNVLYEDLFVQK